MLPRIGTLAMFFIQSSKWGSLKGSGVPFEDWETWSGTLKQAKTPVKFLTISSVVGKQPVMSRCPFCSFVSLVMHTRTYTNTWDKHNTFLTMFLFLFFLRLKDTHDCVTRYKLFKVKERSWFGEILKKSWVQNISLTLTKCQNITGKILWLTWW